MSHTIIVLLEIGVTPVSPMLWHLIDGEGNTQPWDMKCPIEATANLSIIDDIRADRFWAGVSSHEANGGLEQSEPGLSVAKRVVTQHNAAGKTDEAKRRGALCATAFGRCACYPQPARLSNMRDVRSSG